MAIFDYQTTTLAGRLMKGTLEASSGEEANQMLCQMGLQVASITKSDQRPLQRVGRSEFLLFSQQLASITKAGIPLERGLRELAEDIESRSMRQLVVQLADDLQGGMSVEDAFEKHKGAFPPLFGLIVRAGVQSGRLGEMLTCLNRNCELATQTRRIIVEAVTYPVVILTLAAAILSVVMLTVVPGFRAILADLTNHLPTLTRVIFAMSDHVLVFWVAIAVLAGIALVGWPALSRARGGGARKFRERIITGLPLVGRLYGRSMLSRLADAMGLLIGAGCDLPTCLRLSAGATTSPRLIEQCETVAKGVETGQDPVAAGQSCPAIPPILLYAMQTGYQREQLQDNLHDLSEMYLQQARMNQSALQAILMPVMLVLVGLVVGTIILGLFMPLVSVIQAIQG
jgi:type II secretory pathway component PulF